MLRGFVYGLMAALSLTAALHFLRFWKTTHDRFFGFFSLAFAVLGLERTIVALLNDPQEHRIYFGIVRLLGFLIILAAVFDKNRNHPIE